MSASGAASLVIFSAAITWFGSWMIYMSTINNFDGPRHRNIATGFFWTWIALVGMVALPVAWAIAANGS